MSDAVGWGCLIPKFVYISGARSVHSVSCQTIFTLPERGLLCTVSPAPGQTVPETMQLLETGQTEPWCHRGKARGLQPGSGRVSEEM